MNYYPHHIGDFNSATRHLTRIERSVYRDLIELYYDTEAPLALDVDKLCRLLIARSEEEQAAVSQVLNEFFVQATQGWTHARCDAEIARYHGNKEAKSAAGKASAAKRAQKALRPGAISADGQQPLNGCATNQEPEPGTKSQEEASASARKRVASFDVSLIELPEWLDREDWVCWISDRKARKKPVTEEAARRQLQQLAGYLAEGFPARAVIANSIASGYQGLFPPRAVSRPATTSRARQRAEWSSELRDVLAEGRPMREIDMGVIDASH